MMHIELIQYSVNYISIKKLMDHCVITTILITDPKLPTCYTVFKTFYLSNKVLNIHFEHSTQKDCFCQLERFPHMSWLSLVLQQCRTGPSSRRNRDMQAQTTVMAYGN